MKRRKTGAAKWGVQGGAKQGAHLGDHPRGGEETKFLEACLQSKVEGVGHGGGGEEGVGGRGKEVM